MVGLTPAYNSETVPPELPNHLKDKVGVVAPKRVVPWSLACTSGTVEITAVQSPRGGQWPNYQHSGFGSRAYPELPSSIASTANFCVPKYGQNKARNLEMRGKSKK